MMHSRKALASFGREWFSRKVAGLPEGITSPILTAATLVIMLSLTGRLAAHPIYAITDLVLSAAPIARLSASTTPGRWSGIPPPQEVRSMPSYTATGRG
jgi:hypothetical protein